MTHRLAAHGLTLFLLGRIGLGILSGQTILVEAESFTDRGGWVIDQHGDHPAIAETNCRMERLRPR